MSVDSPSIISISIIISSGIIGSLSYTFTDSFWFSAVEAEPRWQQTAPDDADLTFEGENIVGRVEDLTTDTSKLKEFGKNKKLTIKEKIEAKKKQDYRKSLEHDSETQADYIETKYGPGPEPDVGMDEFGNLVDEYGEIID